MASRTAGVAFAIAAGIVVIAVSPRVSIAADDCLTEPTGEKSDAQRWYYRFDRGTNRRCWYLKDANGNTRDIAAPPRTPQQPAPWDFAQPAPPKLTAKRTDGPAPRANAEALAEAPQPRVRTDLAIRGTPKPQNVAITPTTLTASDANLPRSLDASPWPSSPPPQTEPAISDSQPAAAIAADDNVELDSNAAPPAEGPLTATSKSTKPEAPIHVLMLVVFGALAISGLLASALYRLSRMGRKRRRGAEWQMAARTRRSRAKPRTKAKAPAFGQRSARNGSGAGDGFRTQETASALDLASARLSAATQDQAGARPRAAAPAPYQDHSNDVPSRHDWDQAAELPKLQPAEAVWQAADDLAARAAGRHSAMMAQAVLSQGVQTQGSMAQGSMTSADMPIPSAQIAPAVPPATAPAFAAPPAAAAKASASSAEMALQGWSAQTRPAATWPGAQAPDAQIAAPASAAPSQTGAPAAPAPPPAPVDVAEIVSALRKARTGNAASQTPGAAPVDAAKVIAALLVSRAAKRRASQPSTPEMADALPAAHIGASQAAPPAPSVVDRLRNGHAAAPPRPAMSTDAVAASAASSADPAAALIETLRAHAARQTPQQPQDASTFGPEPAAPHSDDADLDDPAAALINLLESRFALAQDELEADGSDARDEAFAPQTQQQIATEQDDPAAQLLSMLESRPSLPPAPAVREPSRRQPPQRALFVPPPVEDAATPPLDFIPRPQALRPRPRNIQQDESLDGIQDILARLGRRA